MAALPLRVRLWAWAAWVLMVLEQTGRAIAPAAGRGLVFVILSLFDVFAALPLWLHWAALALFGAAVRRRPVVRLPRLARARPRRRPAPAGGR